MAQHPQQGRSSVPGVWIWYLVYTELMAFLYAFCLIGGVALFFIDPALFDMQPGERNVIAAILAAMGLILLIPFAVAPFLPRRPWAWVVGIVLIAIGMTSCCTLPACVPLLIYWIRPETRRFYCFGE